MFRNNIQNITFHALKRYCERKEPQYLITIDKLFLKLFLTKEEQQKIDELKAKILDFANNHTMRLRGLTKNNKKNAYLLYDGLTYVVKFEKGIGKIITIFWTR